jgi:diaminopimelate epimerase
VILPFTKMHGLGNDFVVINGIKTGYEPTAKDVKFIADRHFGVGCDQLLLVEAAENGECDFRYRIWNQDGGEVEQCGNGARCFAKFVQEQGLTKKDRIRVETASGVIVLQLRKDGLVTVDMGAPILEPEKIPFLADQQAVQYTIKQDEEELQIGAVSMGNPHLVLTVDNFNDEIVEKLGPKLESHPDFPRRVNVGFMQIESSGRIKLRVYERGVGETLACGTGACAAVVSGIQQDLLCTSVTVELQGGTLEIEWDGYSGSSVMMSGPAESVFEGVIEL